MIDINTVEKIFKGKGYKLTNQRRAITEVLLENPHRFLTVDEIFQKSKDKYPQTNLSTIYRNLEILESAEIVHKTNVNGTNASYELICDDCHHHHVICKTCGKTGIIDFCPLEDLKLVISDDDFVITDHKIEVYGYCKSCANKGSEK